MTFNEKLQLTFSDLNIKKPNESHTKLYYYADYIELIALFSSDYISKSDILDRLKDEGDEFNERRIADGEIGSYDDQDNDCAHSFVNECFAFVKSRRGQYKESYPFLYDELKGIKLREKAKLTNKHKLYLYLLLSSSLQTFVLLTKYITDEFEVLSEDVLKNYLPSHAQVYGFGSNSLFTGCAKNKILKLSEVLNIEVDKRIIEQIPINSSKDEGLDIIGYIPFEDANPNTIIIFGQCACGKNWFGKQNEPKRYERFYRSYINPFSFALFCPRDYHNDKNRFGYDKDITFGQILFERRRLINLASDNILDILTKSSVILFKCLDCNEDIV